LVAGHPGADQDRVAPWRPLARLPVRLVDDRGADRARAASPTALPVWGWLRWSVVCAVCCRAPCLPVRRHRAPGGARRRRVAPVRALVGVVGG